MKRRFIVPYKRYTLDIRAFCVFSVLTLYLFKAMFQNYAKMKEFKGNEV